MKNYKKIVLGLVPIFLILFGIFLISGKANAATLPQNFQSDPSALFNTKFSYKNGQISATIVDVVAINQPSYNLTFVQNSKNKLEYDTTQLLFCQSNVQIVAAPAKLTLTKAPAGSSFQGDLDVYARVQGGSACKHYTATKQIDNQDLASGGNTGPPAMLDYNGNSYSQIGGTELYGLNQAKGSDCYGGSVILANSSFTSGTAFVGLVGNGGAVPLQPSLVKDGASSKVIGLITGCGFQDPAAVTTGYSGAISGSKLNAPVPAAACTGSSCQNNDSSACVFTTNSANLDTGLEWILCPVITGLSKSADGINKFVESQLNFSVKDNLSGSVQKAWAVFRTLASALIVIVLLVMVISQAVGGGPFEAYTIRKLLPRLVAAIIIMQISWELCTWLIRLSNDAGQGIGQLLAAPFGGAGNLDLPSLLNRLSGVWAAGLSFVTIAGLITTVVFAGPLLFFGWPILVLAVILVLIAVIVAMATLLFRNALIILLVILSPLAFLAYVLPGGDKYWKIWRDNFTRLLIFFPLVIAMIYGGRIFAWTAGNLGASGPLDVIMVLAGFFGPYFFLPRTFKWGGTLLATASKGINESWPIKKSRETAQKGLMGRQQRKLNEYAKDLDPNRDGYVRKTGGKRFGIIPNFEGSLARTALWNARAGRIIPTKRGLASAIQRGETWNTEEDAIAAAKIKRMQDKAAAEDPDHPKENPTYTYKLGPDGKVQAELSENATARGKAALFNAAGSTDMRDAGQAVDRSLKTQSWVEMGKNLVPIQDDSKTNPTGMAAQIMASGAEKFVPQPGDPDYEKTKGKFFVRMYDTIRYNSKVNSSEDLYPLPLSKFILATPHITNPDNPGISQGVTRLYQQEENETAKREGRTPVRIAPVPHHIARAVETIRGYIDAGNITSQSEAEFQEFGRLAKQDPRVAKEFGGLLERIASGGQGGINVLTQLNSSASMQGTIRSILEAAPGIVRHDTLDGYLQEGKENMSPAAPAPPTRPDDDGEATAGGRDTGGGGGGGGGRDTGGGVAAPGVSTARGSVSFGPPAGRGSQTGPIELKIDHDALGETIREASRLGTKQGLTQVMRDTGFPRPEDVIRPDNQSGGSAQNPDENDQNNP